MGHIVVMDDSQAQLALTSYSQRSGMISFKASQPTMSTHRAAPSGLLLTMKRCRQSTPNTLFIKHNVSLRGSRCSSAL